MKSATETFERHRPYLLRVAYGMLGRVSQAEDVVQEAWLRWKEADHDKVDSDRAYLSTIVTRLCLDELKSARHRREQYVGPFLPEPFLESKRNTPEEAAERADAISMAVLVLLERLTPVQRAVFLLREVFGYSYATIADTIGKKEAHCRKIAQRAREQIESEKPRFEPDKEEQKVLLESFLEAVNDGELQRLKELLAEEAVAYTDGGGKVTAARKPVRGADNIARFVLGLSKNAPEDLNLEFRQVNGRPGYLVRFGEQLQSVWSFRIEQQQIREIYVVLNPDKLGHLTD